MANYYVELKILGDNALSTLSRSTIRCMFSNTGVLVGNTLTWTEATIRGFINSEIFLSSYPFTEALKNALHWNVASEFILSTRYANAVKRLQDEESIKVQPIIESSGIREIVLPPDIVVLFDKTIYYIPQSSTSITEDEFNVNPNRNPVPKFTDNAARIDVVPGMGHLLYSKLKRGSFINNSIDAYSTYGIGFRQTFLCTDMNIANYMEYLNTFDAVSIVCFQTSNIDKMREMFRGFYENKKTWLRPNIFYLEDMETLYNINILEESLVFHKMFI